MIHFCSIITFEPFPEVIAVSPYRGEFAQVVVCAPNVHILVLWTAHNERVIVTTRTRRDPWDSLIFSNFKIRDGHIWAVCHSDSLFSPEAGFDLTAAVHVAFVLHRQRQISEVIQANARVVWRDQDLQWKRKLTFTETEQWCQVWSPCHELKQYLCYTQVNK